MASDHQTAKDAAIQQAIDFCAVIQASERDKGFLQYTPDAAILIEQLREALNGQ